MDARALTFLAGAVVLSAMFCFWHFAEGFVAWDLRWWVWLVQSYLSSGGVPTAIIYSLVGAAVLLVAVPVFATVAGLGGATLSLGGGFRRDNFHGSARWAEKRDIKRAGLFSTQGVTVGKHRATPMRHDGPEHIICFAPTRSGKGISVVLPTLLEWQQSAVILDIKGENYGLTAGYRKSIGQTVLYFSPAQSKCGVRFNPLEEIRIGQPEEMKDCQNVATMIIDPKGQGLNDFWKQSAFEWLTAAILHTIYVKDSEGEQANLADVKNFVSCEYAEGYSQDPTTNMLTNMREFDHERDSVNEEVVRCATQMLGRSPNERSGVLSHVSIQLGIYVDPIIKQNTAKSDFRMKDIVDSERPVSLYLVVPPTEILRLQPLVKLFLSQLLLRLTSEMVVKDGRATSGHKHQLLLMLDEFTSVGKLEIFATSLAFMAGYGLKCCLIIQDMAQLQETYGAKESITSNCHIRIAFAPNKLDTATLLSGMAGRTTVVSKRQQRHRGHGRQGNSVTEGTSEFARPLITPAEVMQLPGAEKDASGNVVKPGGMLVFPAGAPPIKCSQRLYFQEEALLARTKMPAPDPRRLPATKSAGLDALSRKMDLTVAQGVDRIAQTYNTAVNGDG